MAIAAALLAYLLGSISFAVVVSRAMGLPDPRTFGSRNPGATNVLRTGRKAAAALTLLGDGAKGWLAVYLTQIVFATAVPAGLQDVAGGSRGGARPHVSGISPFSGGKGVATALGVLLALNGWLALGTAATWLVIAFFFRISSLAALIAAVFAPFFVSCCMACIRTRWQSAVIALLLIWRHRSNIRNLLAGNEGRIGGKKQDSGLRIEDSGSP
jgi:glycerol-3-phosphate acyltransferase PlsY